MKVKWEDDDGRQFSIKVFSKEFSWSMVPGDDVKYDLTGRDVIKVGDVNIRYDLPRENVTKVGDVTIRYDILRQKVTQVGGLTIKYDILGKRVLGTRGRVR